MLALCVSYPVINLASFDSTQGSFLVWSTSSLQLFSFLARFVVDSFLGVGVGSLDRNRI